MTAPAKRPGPGRSTNPIKIGVAAFGVIGVSAAALAAAPPADATNYPSWSDVQHAKASVAAQQKLVDEITGLISDLQNQAATAGMQAEVAIEKYHEAQTTLAQATQTANSLAAQAAAADKTAKTSEVRAALLASHLARTAGSDPTLTLLLEGGNASAAEQLLYQLGTMSQLTEQSKQIYNAAIADRNDAASLGAQANAAQAVQKQAADAASTALQAAQAAASVAEAAVSNAQAKQTTLIAQLASLKNTSTEVAAKYIQGQQAAAAAAAAKKAAEEAAQKAAAAKAAAEAAAAAAAAQQQQSSGGAGTGSSSGGSGSGSSSGGPGSGAGGSVPSNPVANSSIAQAAINYAEAQLGKPYIIDGAGPDGFDCSGLTMMAYAYAGVDIGGHSVNQQYYTAASRSQLVPIGDAQPGDLLFWGDSPGNFYHVGIYLGNGMMVAAPDVGDVVKIQAVWGSPYYLVARPSAGM